MVPLIATLPWLMDGGHDCRPVALHKDVGQLVRQRLSLVAIELRREGHFEFTGNAAIDARFCFFGGVPESCWVSRPGWGIEWCKELRRNHSFLSSIVVNQSSSRIGKALACPIRRCRNGRVALRAGEGFQAGVEYCDVSVLR
jgi:hypothetical protein